MQYKKKINEKLKKNIHYISLSFLCRSLSLGSKQKISVKTENKNCTGNKSAKNVSTYFVFKELSVRSSTFEFLAKKNGYTHE